MKIINKLVVTSLLLTVLITNSQAQTTATATATATVVTPISIVKNTDMNFGNISVSPTVGGTVVLTPEGTRSRTAGVSLPAAAGTVTAAAFTVTGLGSYTYSITLPTTPVTLTKPAPLGSTMDATLFTSTPNATGTLASGTQDIKVGATLTAIAAQPAGVYVSGNFNVTVNYN